MTTCRHTAVCLLAALLAATSLSPRAQDGLRSLDGFASPESVVVGPDGRLYVSEIGEFGKDGDGRIAVIDSTGTTKHVFATGLDDPKGLAMRTGVLYVADKTRVWKVDNAGKATVFAAASAFPQPPMFLNDLAFDAAGTLYVSDSGDIQNGGKGAVFAIAPDGKATLVLNESQNPLIKSPNGLLADKPGELLVADFASGDLLRVALASKSVEKLAEGLGGADCIARDAAGALWISDWKGGRVFKLDPRQAGAQPQPLSHRFQAAADCTVSGDGRFLLLPDMKAGKLYWLPTR